MILPFHDGADCDVSALVETMNALIRAAAANPKADLPNVRYGGKADIEAEAESGHSWV
jgi:hypothetical protein